jgi:thiamine biosynthesis protein ThiI
VYDSEKDSEENLQKIQDVLYNTPGIASFVFSKNINLDIDTIKKTSLEIAEEQIQEIIEKRKNQKSKDRTISFKVAAKRSNKHFERTSNELNLMLGDLIYDTLVEKYNLTVDLKNPDIAIYLEICEKNAFIYSNKITSLGGLPVGTSGKVISSMSGGIDSPVASFMMMKRGCKVVFVHAFNKTIAGDGVKQKLIDLVKQLTKFQLHAKLYIVPFVNVQKSVITNIPARYRMIVYRRFMLKIMNKIAKKEHAKAIVTGDSVGQVASQTLDNIICIYNASEYPVLNPLIGMNKDEIIKIAERIGTFETSIIPYPDCCSFMNAESPETNAALREILELEKALGEETVVEELIDASIKESEILSFNLNEDRKLENNKIESKSDIHNNGQKDKE